MKTTKKTTVIKNMVSVSIDNDAFSISVSRCNATYLVEQHRAARRSTTNASRT
jgi:hypothetical protein